jgi:hypothetical protein
LAVAASSRRSGAMQQAVLGAIAQLSQQPHRQK